MIWRLLLICLFVIPLRAQLVLEKEAVSVLGIRVSFSLDDDFSSTGNGTFLAEPELEQCGNYLIDPPPTTRVILKRTSGQLITTISPSPEENSVLIWTVPSFCQRRHLQAISLIRHCRVFTLTMMIRLNSKDWLVFSKKA